MAANGKVCTVCKKYKFMRDFQETSESDVCWYCDYQVNIKKITLLPKNYWYNLVNIGCLS